MVDFKLDAFQEPRGVMRILQFIFAICAFASTTNFEVKVSVVCGGVTNMTAVIDYPFAYSEQVCRSGDVGEKPIYISGDMSSDSQFFVATGVLSMLYCLFIIAVYGFIDQMYKDKPEFPMADFILTTLLAIFWLSGSAAWSNGTSALKSMTDIDLAVHCSDAYKNCTYLRSSFSSLNISLLLGYLNFFLWASDLWFLYKETLWFQNRIGGGGASSSGMSPGGGHGNI